MIRITNPGGAVYVLSKEEDVIIQDFLRGWRSDCHSVKPNGIARLVQALTDERGAWDPNHDQEAKCSRLGCNHTYERHFDPYADMEPVGCKYCGHVKCPAFVEPG